VARPARRLPAASSPARLVAIALVAASALLASPPACLADGSLTAARPGDPGMPAHPAALLVGHLERFLKDHDLDAFRRGVEARYTEGTLCRATYADDVRIRRAAVLALGVGGSYACNATVARRLKDKDPATRSMAVSALWAIWSRADTPENNAELEAIQALIQGGRHDEAIRRSGRLVERAPTFAEAYNQRAIAYFHSRRFAESAADCRRVLDLNPYHFGALAGLGQCQLGLRQRAEAIRTFRRALELQPYSGDLRETVAELEAAED
jgi:tetratricopeptide (TPR) repeat protein